MGGQIRKSLFHFPFNNPWGFPMGSLHEDRPWGQSGACSDAFGFTGSLSELIEAHWVRIWVYWVYVRVYWVPIRDYWVRILAYSAILSVYWSFFFRFIQSQRMLK